MADSGALRARRHRQHKAGDHSLCRGTCGEIREEKRQLRAVAASSGDFPGLDPDTEMRELARTLARAYADDPSNALLARELRMTLQSLQPRGAPADTELADLLHDLSS